MLLSLSILLAAPATINHKVRIDGKTYRVEIKGRTVEVYDKSIITGRTPERGELLRQAVRQATGCVLKDGYWSGAHLRGLLDCTGSPAPPQ